MIRQQNAERRTAQRDVAGLPKRLVVEDQLAVGGDQHKRGRRVILEPHAARTLEPGGALRDAAISGDLRKARLQRFDAVQIGLDPRGVRLILGGQFGSGGRHDGQTYRPTRGDRQQEGPATKHVKPCGVSVRDLQILIPEGYSSI